MAFIKREDTLGFSLDEDIYNSYINRNVRGRQNDFQVAGNLAHTVETDDDVQHISHDSQVQNCGRAQDNLVERLQGNFPFPIKLEDEEINQWPMHADSAILDSNETQLIKSNSANSQNMSLDLATAYNNSLFYQNLQSTAPFQQVLPLEFYGRHHQALANSILSAYSNTNNSNLTAQQYFKPNQEQLNGFTNSKDSNININQPNVKRKDLQCDILKNINTIYSQAMNNRIQNNLDAMVNQNALCEMSRKMNSQVNVQDVKETSVFNNFYNCLKSETSNGIVKLPPFEKPHVTASILNDRLLMDRFKNGQESYDEGVGSLNNSDHATVSLLPSMKTVKKESALKCGKCFTEFICEQEHKDHSINCGGESFQLIPQSVVQPKKSTDIEDGFAFPSELESRGRYSCENCSYSCQSPAILKIHERTHSGEKPFSCSFCDYKSGQKNNVAKHILVHMKEKPFRCQYCEYKCAQKNNLIVHERTHTGEKPFACTFCEYKTVQKPNLVKHMYLHTNEKPFACDVCDYRCVQKTNLLKHKQKHSLEKPFGCTDCDYKCSQKSNLNKHLFLHTKDKPFQCEFCAYRCVQKCNLAKHVQSKHNMLGSDALATDTALTHCEIVSCVYSERDAHMKEQMEMRCEKEENNAFKMQGDSVM